MNRITDAVGGRKFAAFISATIALVSLYAFGFELNESTLNTIEVMYIAFAGGNGVEHIANRLGNRTAKPALDGLPADVSAALDRIANAVEGHGGEG